MIQLLHILRETSLHGLQSKFFFKTELHSYALGNSEKSDVELTSNR